MAIVCVGTPSRPSGALDTRSVQNVARRIGEAVTSRARPFTIVMRSTMLLGSMQNVVIPALEDTSGRKAGDVYDVLFHPEFLREGSPVWDFYNPSKIVVGGASKALQPIS